MNSNKNQIKIANFKTLPHASNFKSRHQNTQNEEMEEWNIYDDPSDSTPSKDSQFDFEEFKYYQNEAEIGQKSNF